jgi:hypothetical protein
VTSSRGDFFNRISSQEIKSHGLKYSDQANLLFFLERERFSFENCFAQFGDVPFGIPQTSLAFQLLDDGAVRSYGVYRLFALRDQSRPEMKLMETSLVKFKPMKINVHSSSHEMPIEGGFDSEVTAEVLYKEEPINLSASAARCPGSNYTSLYKCIAFLVKRLEEDERVSRLRDSVASITRDFFSKDEQLHVRVNSLLKAAMMDERTAMDSLRRIQRQAYDPIPIAELGDKIQQFIRNEIEGGDVSAADGTETLPYLGPP